MQEFYAGDIEDITRIKRNRIQAWIEKGYCKPSVRSGTGPGIKNVWNIYDLYTLAMFKKVTETGISRQLVADILSEGGFDPKKIKPAVLKSLQHRVFFLENGKVKSAIVITYGKGKNNLNINELAKRLQIGSFDVALVINLQVIFSEVDTAVKKWAETR